MPGRDYTKAYKLLEQSIVGRDNADDDPAHSSEGEDLDSVSAHIGLAPLESRKRGSYTYTGSLRLLTPPQINGYGSALPLTPLSQSGSSTVSDSQVVSAASISGAPYVTTTTPPNQVDPPTPDLTPPNRVALQPPAASSIARLASPSESFQTAREDISSNTTGTPHLVSELESPREGQPTLPDIGRLEELQEEEAGLDFHLPNGDSEAEDQVTPRAHNTTESSSQPFFTGEALEDEQQADDSDDMSTVVTTTSSRSDPFRHVSVRKTRRLYESGHPNSKLVMHGDSEAAVTSPLSDAVTALKDAGIIDQDTTVRKSRDFTWPVGTKARAHYQARELSEERQRSKSRTPPVIQAMVVDSPPTRARKLRHVSNCSSLRDEASIHSHSERSTRNSFGSDKSPPQVLHHMKKQIPDRRERRLSRESDASPNSSPSLRRRRDTIPSRPSTAPEQDIESDIPVESAGLGIIEEVQPNSSTKDVSQQVPVFQPETPDMVDQAVSKALRAKPGPSHTPVVQERFYQPVDGEDEYRSGKNTTPDGQLLPPPDFRHHGHPARNSIGQTTIASSRGRRSLDQEKSAISSPLYFRLGSLGSLQSGTPELIEANAVPLFSHNNGSLQLVEHTPPASRSLAFPPEYPTITGQQQPKLAIEPATPTIVEPAVHGVDSPLKNPRPAPELPMVAVIPPTPAKELEAEELRIAKQRSSSAPAKQGTFLQRARRYSGNLTESLRRSVSGRRPIPPVSEAQGRLHPFWRPRHFWNDLSDSEDEYDDDDDDDYYDDEGYDELPRGGDTSNVQTPPPETFKEKFKRGGSFRGFLIGNSLGIQRGPTNKRRPVIILPSRRGISGSNTGGSPSGGTSSSAQRLEKHTSVRKSAARSGSVRRPRGRSTTRFFGVFKNKMRSLSERRAERAREKNREEIRASIGPSWYVDHEGTGGRVRE